jgi:hypothetical protein
MEVLIKKCVDYVEGILQADIGPVELSKTDFKNY